MSSRALELGQARALAKTLSGEPTAYEAFPWFWSDQGSIKLQMAGDSRDASEISIIEGSQPPQVAAFCFDAENHLCAVETINWPAYHALSRKAMSDGRIVSREQLAAVNFDLKILRSKFTAASCSRLTMRPSDIAFRERA